MMKSTDTIIFLHSIGLMNMKGFGNKENNVKTIGYYAVIDKDSYHIISYLIIAIKYFDINTLNNNVNFRFIFAFSSIKISGFLLEK